MNNRGIDLSEIGIESRAIYEILVKILEKWRLEIKLEEIKPEERKLEEDKLEETVILSPQERIGDGFPSSPLKPKDMDLDELMASQQETVILSPREAIGDGFPSSPLKSKDMDLNEITASQKEIDRMGSEKGPQEQSKGNEFLEETIILKPRKLQGRDKDKVNG